ncbi:MAG: hypothetical protein F4Y27_06590 [Acidimicrobiaceae bacterium]|nr:hypothetical protein [Acidimicrobiaceae bacterium]MYA74326.1 hypothetical protein [Acidimicrobiaceae bacterium]MYG55951.1 hypothetical protein [Acidimicrobiaceae bacterium]MYJ97847.1 hypothetical protein [Acidimicrobiaceae bacterium]
MATKHLQHGRTSDGDMEDQEQTLTIEDLKASTGKGPRLDPEDIANTYYSDEEFLAALEARRNETPTA